MNPRATTNGNVISASEIRSRFIEFFKKRDHAVISSASLITTDEKGITNPTLFNTAGMQPLILYLLGKPYIDPVSNNEVKRIVDVQKCLRTVDIDDIGDKTHATFFEMLGNWSLGDYFKEDAIKWSYEFLTSKEEGLGLDPNRLYVTVFEGDPTDTASASQGNSGSEPVPRDDEAVKIWKEVFKSDTKNGVSDIGGDTSKGEVGRIFYMGAEMNWWQAGENGPCGPDTEMYYDVGDPVTGKSHFDGKGITKEEFKKADASRRVVEVWNNVFMQYEKKDGKIIGKLPKPSVDTGAGLERLAMMIQGVDNIFDTDLLKPVMKKIGAPVGGLLASQQVRPCLIDERLKSARIVADHIRSAVFLIADGVIPSNTDRGYVLRKLIRRAVRHLDKLLSDKLHTNVDTEKSVTSLSDIARVVQKNYSSVYPNVVAGKDGEFIRNIIEEEETKFRATLKQGLKEFEKGVDAFTLFSSYGFPLELSLELAKEKGITIDTADFEEKFKAHQQLSRTGAEKKFKGGLADTSDPMVVRYHTATHLLHQALHDVLGDGVMQKGSNITTERLRFDFAHGMKMTDEQKKKVEQIVNQKISEKLPVTQIEMSREEAEKTGAHHFFGEKYGDEISIYFVGKASTPPAITDLALAYSKEFCGGPHVANTSELAGPEGKWVFKIQKEEAVAQGVRRIKAVLG